MKITKRQLQRLIREAISREGLPAAVEASITENPGISGDELINAVLADPNFQGTDSKDIYASLDEMIEDGMVFFDTEEDAWYLADSPEAIAAMDAQDQFSSREANPHDGGMYGEDRY